MVLSFPSSHYAFDMRGAELKHYAMEIKSRK